MLKASVLARNLEPSITDLDFGEFTINPVGLRADELKEVLSQANSDDWILEKSYPQPPLGSPDSVDYGIPADIEKALFLLRLYQEGEIAFISLAITTPEGIRRLPPYRAINDLNSYSYPQFDFVQEKCEQWKRFADGIRSSLAWNSDWFTTARRFFLSGGAKQFSPRRDDVDRIVDYAIALESALVPERDYNTRRIRHRAAALIAADNPVREKAVAGLIKGLYDIRSRIAHGSGLDDKSREWLVDNSGQIERLVRQILVAAVQKLPPREEDRCLALTELYDPTDADRGDLVFGKFKEIKTVEVRKALAAKIVKLAGDEPK